VAFNEHLMHEMHEVPLLVKLSATIVMLIGLGVAWMAYIKDTTIPARFTAQFGGLYRFLLNKWYWDELYDFLFVRPAFALGRLFWKRGDQGLIDRFGPNGFAELVVEGNKLAARFQSGYLASYALVMLIGVAAAATWAITR
jgi:NADH-quinone oxidoreductase subunit L